MKLITFIICAALSTNTFTLGGYGSLSGDSKKITDSIKNKLEISNDDAFELYDLCLKDYIETKNWHYNLFDNKTLESSKFKESPNKTVLVNFITDNRYINVTFVKYAKEKQILVQAVETLPRTSELALEKNNAIKKDSSWKSESDQSEFAVFGKDGRTDKIKILVNSGVGGIQYVNLIALDLKSN